MNSHSYFRFASAMRLIFLSCLILPSLSISQSIKVQSFTINYPSNTRFDLSVCAPYTEYSVEGMNTPDGMGFTYDYYDEAMNQFKSLLTSLMKSGNPFDCTGAENNSPMYKLECRLESRSEGKVVTAFSSISLEITMTWKLTRLKDGEVIFREKAIGLHKNKIGNAFSGKANAKERATKALEMAFQESRKILEMKFGEIK